MDDIIKQLVLRLKVEGENDLTKIQDTLTKHTQNAGKSFPTREMADVLRMSEKIGGSFKEMVNELKTLRLTGLKAEVKDLNSSLQTMLDNLSRARASGNTRAQAFLTQRIMNTGDQMGSAQEEIAGMSGGGGMSKFAARMNTAGQVIGAAAAIGGVYAQAQEAKAAMVQSDIQRRLNSIDQMMMPIKREQSLYYSGQLSRLSIERSVQEDARRTANEQVKREEEVLKARKTGAGFGTAAGVGTGLIGAGMAMGATGIGAPIGAGFAAAGAVMALGGFAAAGYGMVRQYRASEELRQYQANEKARAAELATQNTQTLARAKIGAFQPQMEALEAAAPGANQAARQYGGTALGGLGMQTQSVGDLSLQQVQSLTNSLAPLLGYNTASSIIYSIKSRRGDVKTNAALAAQISKQGFGPETFDQTRKFSMNTEAGTLLQNIVSQRTAGVSAGTSTGVNAVGVSGSEAAVMGMGTRGMTPMAASEAMAKADQMQNTMTTAGTMNENIYQSKLRKMLARQGFKGMELTQLEGILSQYSINDLVNNDEVKATIKSYGRGLNAEMVLKARSDSFAASAAPFLNKQEMADLKSGHFRDKNELRRIGQKLGGGSDVGAAGVVGARAFQELHPQMRAATVKDTTKILSPQNQAIEDKARAVNQAQAGALTSGVEAFSTVGNSGPNGPNPTLNQKKIQDLFNSNNAGAPSGAGDLQGKVDNVANALSEFVKALREQSGGGTQEDTAQ